MAATDYICGNFVTILFKNVTLFYALLTPPPPLLLVFITPPSEWASLVTFFYCQYKHTIKFCVYFNY